ncbi:MULTISPECIES: ribosome maturation factor RimM [unclassified Desulfurobacterium]|uniref:ribosome maturation factor RimM n=1 Tax=unclassified Desulfurobacterium TaxID=2639089 RepID=UPI0003B64401|nr:MULTISPECIES: ribosome maturation factor RimM [unclassified Desulfurobacterium]
MKKRSIKEILERRKKKIDHSNEVLIGKIVGAHGIKGDVKIKPESDIFERQISHVKTLSGYRGTAKKNLTIESIKPYKNIFIAKFKEIEDRNQAESAINTELYIKKEDTAPLESNEFFFEDLIGCTVVTEEKSTVGKVKEIMEMPASHILVVEKEDGKEALIPFIDEFVKDINVKEKIITIKPIEGLI